jgi:hypothetical protein
MTLMALCTSGCRALFLTAPVRYVGAMLAAIISALAAILVSAGTIYLTKQKAGGGVASEEAGVL